MPSDFFSCGTQRVIPRGQDITILPARAPITKNDLVHLAHSQSQKTTGGTRDSFNRAQCWETNTMTRKTASETIETQIQSILY